VCDVLPSLFAVADYVATTPMYAQADRKSQPGSQSPRTAPIDGAPPWTKGPSHSPFGRPVIVPDTEEVTGSIPVSPTSNTLGGGRVQAKSRAVALESRCSLLVKLLVIGLGAPRHEDVVHRPGAACGHRSQFPPIDRLRHLRTGHARRGARCPQSTYRNSTTARQSCVATLAGIRVNCVSSGTADTPRVRRLLNAVPDPHAKRKALEAQQQHGRLVDPAEVAGAVAYLASTRSGSTTGVPAGQRRPARLAAAAGRSVAEGGVPCPSSSRSW
jgi:hypothetical protein